MSTSKNEVVHPSQLALQLEKSPRIDIASGNTEQTRQRKSRKIRGVKIYITVDRYLLKRIDATAKQEFTSRSALIRAAARYYVRPLGRDLDQIDPESIIKLLNRKYGLANLRRYMAENEIDAYE